MTPRLKSGCRSFRGMGAPPMNRRHGGTNTGGAPVPRWHVGHVKPLLCQTLRGILLIGFLTRGTFAEPPGPIPAPASAPASTTHLDTARAIEEGLRYLASVQHDDGSWSLSDGGSPVGVTGYALTAFLDAGCRPGEGVHSGTVLRAITFLAGSQRDEGVFFSAAPGRWPHTMYDHAAATVALSRVASITRDAALRAKVARGAKFIVSCQDSSGGWRYKPVAQDPPDLPVSAAQICALCAARDAGADVPRATIDSGLAYLRKCRDPETGGFCYTPNGHNPGFARTAAALCAMEAAGLGNDDKAVKTGLDFLFQTPGPREREEQGHWFAYGRYYAAHAAHRAGREVWSRWNDRARPDVLSKAIEDEKLIRWEEPHAVPPDAAYHTALNLTILALSRPSHEKQ
ncbi:MAG: hypothetical protein JWM97_3076 [Phycisphaerales bacterium]|nr:hypothetical protein [Phycisphaerales bacterium]